MIDEHRREIDHNYDFFQRSLKQLLAHHEGEYALLRQRAVVGYYSAVGDAYRDAILQFPDRLFSIQLVTREPVELGNWSVAVA